LGLHDLQAALAVDRAMAALLGQPLPEVPEGLEHLVNGELVWQAAQAVDFKVADDQVAESLGAFLAAAGRSQVELEQALAERAVDWEDFERYYARLLTIDRFSHEQADRQGVTVVEYLKSLQEDSSVYLLETEIAAADLDSEIVPQDSVLEATEAASLPPTPTEQISRGTAPGQYAPEFSLPLLDGSGVLALEDFRGKPLLLSFWSVWCGHCRTQTPVLVEAYPRYAEQVQFVGLSIVAAQEEVAAYVEEQQIAYPILSASDGAAVRDYGVTGVPTTFFLDAEGRVVASHVGALSADDLEAYLGQVVE